MKYIISRVVGIDCYEAYCPRYGIASYGTTKKEARAMIADAVDCFRSLASKSEIRSRRHRKGKK